MFCGAGGRGRVLPPRGHLEKSGDILVVKTGGEMPLASRDRG